MLITNLCSRCHQDIPNVGPYTTGFVFEDNDAFIWYCQSCINNFDATVEVVRLC
jgi:hypothetical protein